MDFGRFLVLCMQIILIRQCNGYQRNSYSLIYDYCPEYCFCPRLEEVWCKNVPMTSIPDRMWPTLQNLTIINADLDRLPPNAFSPYHHLERIHLESCKIESIESNAFKGLPRLRLLRVYGNNIHRLSAGSFSHLSHVKEVYLTNNNITRIGKDAFHSSLKLGTLDLRYNPVDTLESGSFNGLKHVDRLLISDLTTIESGAFENLTHVNYLEIRQWNAKWSADGGIGQRTFKGLGHVKTLQIEKSQLGVIQSRAFDGMSHVEYLYIRNSVIDRIRKRSFVGIKRIRRLGLTKNFIDRIDYMALFADQRPLDEDYPLEHQDTNQRHHQRRHQVHFSDPKKQYDINKNQFNCTCPKNAWILYDQDVIANFTSVLRNNTCTYPYDYMDLYTASVDFAKKETCEYVDDSQDENSAVRTIRFSWIALVFWTIFVQLIRRDFW